jgi:RNA polymerase sigma-70 factor (ECF subfamily)
MGDIELPSDLGDALRESWQRYLDLLNPIRPDLYRYCRRLTGCVWDAEDLVQETLVRAFATLGKAHPGVGHPRAYLLRTATNAWIDTLRRRGGELLEDVEIETSPASQPAPGALREAGAALIQRLSPQERAALVLKEVFELSLEEAADVLQTTPGAVKSALYRARGRLSEPAAALLHRAPSEALVDRFVAAFNAADLPGLTALLLDGASIEQLGCAWSTGRKALEEGFLTKAVYGHPEWPAALQYEASRLERAAYRGEPIALGLVVRRGREALEQVMRFEEMGGSVACIRTYAFCPEAMRELGEALGLRVRTGLYRYPTPAPGKLY